MRRFRMRLAVVVAASAFAAAGAFWTGGSQAQAADKVALLIGNSSYTHVSPLRNPGNDVALLNEKLTRLGFVVEVATNLDLTNMNRALRRFNERARQADTAFFFYAGHGMEIGGSNYLVPTDAELQHPGDEEVEAMTLSKAIAAASHARRLSVVVIDACRDNRFASLATRSLTRGFKAVEAKPRQIVAFSTAPGALAFDGDGNVSPFTRALAEALDKADQLDVRILFGGLGPRLSELVESPQVPFMHSSGFGTDLVTLTGAQLVAYNPELGGRIGAQQPGEPAPFDQTLAPQRHSDDLPSPPQERLPNDALAAYPSPMKRPDRPTDGAGRREPPVAGAGDSAYSASEWAAVEEAFRADIERSVLESVGEAFDIFPPVRQRPTDRDQGSAVAEAAVPETGASFFGGDSNAERFENVAAEAVAVELGAEDAAEPVDPRLESAVAEAETLTAGVGIEPAAFAEAAEAAASAQLATVISGANLPTGPQGLRDLSKFQECEDCPQMVVLPGGPFLMGSPETEPERSTSEGPLTAVALGRFAIGVYEVTFNEWDACVADGYCERSDRLADDRGQGRGRMPVVYVSDYDISSARGFIAWLNSKVDGAPYRLPSEAEWEYAARGDTSTPFATGDKISPLHANYDGLGQSRAYASYRGVTSVGHATIVGAFTANRFGIHDMHGNVWERVADCWSGDLTATPADGAPRGNGACERGVMRGGSYANAPRDIRSAARFGVQRTSRAIGIGFRVARDL